MSRLIIILVIFIFAILQVTALDYIRICHIKPDILLVGVIFFGLYNGPRVGLGVGLFSGLLEDIFSSGVFGVNTLCFGLCGLVIGRLGNKLYRDSLFTQIFVTFISAISVSLLYYLFSRVFLGAPPFLRSFRFIIFPLSIYTSLSAPLVFFLLKRCFKIR